MSYKDRECYLGASQTLGYLDKGGKWRRRDWYAQAKDGAAETRKSKLQAEIELKKSEEKALMNFKLGIADDTIKGCQDVKQVLEAVRDQFLQRQAEKLGQSMSVKNAKVSSLSQFEIKELTQKMNGGDSQVVVNPSDIMIEEEDPEMVLQRADRIKGVGFDKQHILSTTAPMAKDDGAPETMNEIKAVNVEDLKYLDQQKKLSMIGFLTEKIKAEKEARRAEKAAKKEEKRKLKKSKSKNKHKKKHRRDDRSRSRSSSVESKASHDSRKRSHRVSRRRRASSQSSSGSS